jgi:hypothetical protein
MLQISIKKEAMSLNIIIICRSILVVNINIGNAKLGYFLLKKDQAERNFSFFERWNAEVTKMAKFGFSFYCVKIDLNFLKMIFF